LVLTHNLRRVACPECDVRVARVPWADRRVTKGLARAVAELSRQTDLSTVVGHYGTNCKTVAGILHRVVQWGIKRRRKKTMHMIGLDEVDRNRGHRYLALVYDLGRCELVWVRKERSTEMMAAFFDELGQRRCKTLQAVSLDMEQPHMDTVMAYAPQATTCFYRFQMVRHLNELVDDECRSLVRKLVKDLVQDLVKGMRFVPLKNRWNLPPLQKESLTVLARNNSRPRPLQSFA
jgi:transposase